MSETDHDKAHLGQGGSVFADSTDAAVMLSRLEDSEARRLGVRVDEARASIARRIRSGVGTLRNIRRRRRKAIPAWLMDRIRAELVAVLSHEITKLTHEIAIHRQAGAHHSTDALLAAEAQVEVAKKILGRSE